MSLFQLSIVNFCLKLVIATHFPFRCQKDPYFFPNFEHFTFFRFWLNLRCVFLSQLSIVHFCPKIVIATYFRLGRQIAPYLSPNFEHFTIVLCLWNWQCASLLWLLVVRSKILEFQFFYLDFWLWKLVLNWTNFVLVFRFKWYLVYIIFTMFLRTFFQKNFEFQKFVSGFDFENVFWCTSKICLSIVRTLVHNSRYFHFSNGINS